MWSGISMIQTDLDTFILFMITHEHGMRALFWATPKTNISYETNEYSWKNDPGIITLLTEVSGRFLVSYFYVTDIHKLLVVG